MIWNKLWDPWSPESKLQKSALLSNSPALTPGSSYTYWWWQQPQYLQCLDSTHQWASTNPRTPSILQPPPHDQVLLNNSIHIGRAWWPVRLGSSQAQTVSHLQQKDSFSPLGEALGAYSLNENREYTDGMNRMSLKEGHLSKIENVTNLQHTWKYNQKRILKMR